VAYNFQTGSNKIKLLTQYESVTQKVLFDNALLAEAMCVLWFFKTKSIIKTQRRYRTQYGKDPLSDNAIRCWLKQFQETEQEDVDRILEAFSRSPQKSTRRTFFAVRYTTNDCSEGFS
jgi:hypothetical protein